MGLSCLSWLLAVFVQCAEAADGRTKTSIWYDGTPKLEVFAGSASEAVNADVHMDRKSIMRQERSAKLFRTSDSAEPLALSSAVHKTVSAFRNILCQGESVRVLIRPNGYRLIQFRNDNGEWLMEEGRMRCNEDAMSCEKREDSPSVATCPRCDCSAMHPIEDFWSPYQGPMLAKVASHCSSLKEYNVIVVGLGTSSGLQGVAQHCNLGRVSVVEKQQEVVDAATKFFGLNTSRIGKNTTKVLAPYDCAQGLKKLAEDYGAHAYDAVLVDCMIQGRIPEGCRSPDFYAALARNLKPGALVFQWSWRQDQHDVQTKLSHSLGSPVDIFQMWATGHEPGNPASLAMLSGNARAREHNK